MANLFRLVMVMVVISLSETLIVAGQETIVPQEGETLPISTNRSTTEKTIDEIVIDGLLKIVTDVDDNADIRIEAIALLGGMQLNSDNKKKVVTAMILVAQTKTTSDDSLRVREEVFVNIAKLMGIQKGTTQSGGQFGSIRKGNSAGRKGNSAGGQLPSAGGKLSGENDAGEDVPTPRKTNPPNNK